MVYIHIVSILNYNYGVFDNVALYYCNNGC